ncbi:MAG TPA: hypothetical protein VF939_03245 [Puia sp.]
MKKLFMTLAVVIETSIVATAQIDNGINLDADHYAFKDHYTLFFTPDGKLIKEEKNC